MTDEQKLLLLRIIKEAVEDDRKWLDVRLVHMKRMLDALNGDTSKKGSQHE